MTDFLLRLYVFQLIISVSWTQRINLKRHFQSETWRARTTYVLVPELITVSRRGLHILLPYILRPTGWVRLLGSECKIKAFWLTSNRNKKIEISLKEQPARRYIIPLNVEPIGFEWAKKPYISSVYSNKISSFITYELMKLWIITHLNLSLFHCHSVRSHQQIVESERSATPHVWLTTHKTRKRVVRDIIIQWQIKVFWELFPGTLAENCIWVERSSSKRWCREGSG